MIQPCRVRAPGPRRTQRTQRGAAATPRPSCVEPGNRLHRRPPPLWPRDGGGALEDACCDASAAACAAGAWTTGTMTAPCGRPRTPPSTPHLWWRLAWPAVLLLVARVLPATAAAAAAAAAGLGTSSSATVPPLPPFPQLPPPLPPHSAYRQSSSQSLASLVTDKLDKLDDRLDKMDTRLDKLDVRLDKMDEKLRVMDKLDEKLRVVETMWDTRYRLDTLDRRLGDLDSKVERRMGELDSTLERRFDKLTESVASHDHKDSSAKDQLARKVDNVYERIVYMENNSINKIQVTASSILDKAQSAAAELQRAVEQAVGQAVGQARTELRAGLTAVHAQVNATHDHVLNATTAVALQAPAQDDDESERRACADAAETTTKTIKQHIDVKTDLVSSKVSNLYNDMWRRVNTLESTVKSMMSLFNATRREVQALNVAVAGMQHGMQHGAQHRGYPRQTAVEPGNLEYALNLHHTALERQLRELRDTLLDELRSVQNTQDSFLRTCNRLNDKDHSTDEKLGHVLEHHTDYLLKQHTMLTEVKKQLKTHSTLAGRAASNATEGIKRLEAAVRGLVEQGLLEARRLEHALERVDNASAAMQNVSDRVSACGGSLGLGAGLESGVGLAEEDAAWSELLQHNDSVSAVTEAQPQSSLAATATTASSVSGGGSSSAATSADIVLVDSNGLQRPPPKEAAGLAGHATTQEAAGLGELGGSNGLHREQRREAERQLHSTDSGQDGVTDLSSVDEDVDYAETDDDEAELLD